MKNKDIPSPFDFLCGSKPDYLPLAIWRELNTIIYGGGGWMWSASFPLLFGANSPKLFKLLNRKPSSRSEEDGLRQFNEEDYVNWLMTHVHTYAHFIAVDRHHDFQRVKGDLREARDLASELASKLVSLYQYKNAKLDYSDILPAECKQLSRLYQRAVFHNNGDKGKAKTLEELGNTYGYAGDNLGWLIHQIENRQELPSPADMLLAMVEGIDWHIQRFASDGEYGLTIDGYQPESLPARYIALFDKGLPIADRRPMADDVPRISHAAMSLQCSLVFGEEISRDRVIEIRKRAKI
ncbi:hypothetical protein [Paludibacterium sp. THUN1379]|uniref:hypothetical protein n=1 Tax=Paludibacterium sp. THUN1379 TaxID=3112107 RepID=UPI0030D2E940